MEKKKITRFFSKPLMKQSIKGNYILMIAITAIMCLMCVVSTYAMSLMGTRNNSEQVQEAQEDFYTYLYVMASYNEQAGTNLSYEDFEKTEDKSMYEMLFAQASQQSEEELTEEGLEDAIATLKASEVPVETYVKEFEYVYALGNVQGCFSDENLSIDDMMETLFTAMGMDADMMENLQNMDTTALFDQMNYTVMGLLPIFIFVVIAGNALVADQVDRGSMAYVLSTPTKRSAVTTTQAVFLIVSPAVMLAVTCIARLLASHAFLEEYSAKEIVVLYVGMYLLVEAVAGICYLGSCIFDRSKNSMAFGGGLTVWFFLASLLGMFGSEDMVNMGFGAEALNIFNKLTLVGLYDVKAIATVATDSVDTAFIWKLAVLAGIALVCYVVGAKRFQKKDLPL